MTPFCQLSIIKYYIKIICVNQFSKKYSLTTFNLILVYFFLFKLVYYYIPAALFQIGSPAETTNAFHLCHVSRIQYHLKRMPCGIR